MTPKEFVAYALTIAAQTAEEPTASPILDADMALEFLLPAVLQDCTRSAYQGRTYLHTLIKTHGIEINRGFGALPAGLQEQFVESFQVAKIAPLFIRSIVPQVSKEAFSDTIAAESGKGGFAELVDTGFIIAVELDGIERVRARIEDVLTADSVSVRDYEVGASSTIVANLLASAKVYSPQYVLNRTFTAHKEGASQDVNASNPGEGLGTDADIGALIVITVAGTIVLRAIITAAADDLFTIAGYAATIIAEGAGTASIYHLATPAQVEEGYFTPEDLGLFSWCPHYADYLRDTADIMPKFCVRDQMIFVKDANDADLEDGTGIVVIGVTVPQVPATEDAEIDVTEAFLDDVLMVAAAVMRGERSIESLGYPVPAKLRK